MCSRLPQRGCAQIAILAFGFPSPNGKNPPGADFRVARRIWERDVPNKNPPGADFRVARRVWDRDVPNKNPPGADLCASPKSLGGGGAPNNRGWESFAVLTIAATVHVAAITIRHFALDTKSGKFFRPNRLTPPAYTINSPANLKSGALLRVD